MAFGIQKIKRQRQRQEEKGNQLTFMTLGNQIFILCYCNLLLKITMANEELPIFLLQNGHQLGNHLVPIRVALSEWSQTRAKLNQFFDQAECSCHDKEAKKKVVLQ